MSLSLILCAAILPAQAQTAAAKAGPADPTDSHASVPAVPYASVLARYRPIQETPPVSWQHANEKANQAGGWRTYAREKAEAVRLARAGVSMRAIGRRMGVDRKAVRVSLVEAGLIADDPSERS